MRHSHLSAVAMSFAAVVTAWPNRSSHSYIVHPAHQPVWQNNVAIPPIPIVKFFASTPCSSANSRGGLFLQRSYPSDPVGCAVFPVIAKRYPVTFVPVTGFGQALRAPADRPGSIWHWPVPFPAPVAIGKPSVYNRLFPVVSGHWCHQSVFRCYMPY